MCWQPGTLSLAWLPISYHSRQGEVTAMAQPERGSPARKLKDCQTMLGNAILHVHLPTR